MSQVETVSAFVEGAPPGEANIKALTVSSPDIVSELTPAFEKYNEEQLVTVKLPGSSQPVVISSHNALGDGRYYDVESSSSFAVDHATQAPQKASAVKTHAIEGPQVDLVYVIIELCWSGKSLELIARSTSTLKGLSAYVKEHFPNASYGAYPIESDSKVAIIIVANKYSPNNFWYELNAIDDVPISPNGRWRSQYVFDPASGSLEGSIKVDVHYYEDGNVRLLTNKPVTASITSRTGAGIAKEISATERKYQEELNKGFVNLSENAFKSLRRQLPVTRQKIAWDKVMSYRLGQDIGGGNSKGSSVGSMG
ncbi:F-actin-capping protein subunit alpha [Metarhizium anisopliae]|nr:F-actin-capping protein subunit alpha [Metarhizium anisopliae]